jgi:hypothetical protein
MDTTDDIFGGGGSMPTVEAQNTSKVAGKVDSTAEGLSRQKRMAASFLTKNWMDEPVLGQQGLIGL